jgi:hypothetical protein
MRVCVCVCVYVCVRVCMYVCVCEGPFGIVECQLLVKELVSSQHSAMEEPTAVPDTRYRAGKVSRVQLPELGNDMTASGWAPEAQQLCGTALRCLTSAATPAHY